MANSDMLVRIKANTDNYNAGIAKAKRTLEGFKQENLTIGGILNQSTKSIVAAAAQYASFAAVLGTVASGFAEAVSTGSAMAREMEGVKMAFDRLNQPGLLDNLREATHGTVNDLELMKQAVKFDNFNLSLEQMGTMLAFAQQQAKDTGQDVGYLVDSIVTGLGRKSLPILDNLGLSATEIRERMKETGDMTKAVAEIIQERMAAAGGYVETAADRAAQAQVRLDNAMTELGNTMNSLSGSGAALWSELKIGAINLANTAIKPLISLFNQLASYINGSSAEDILTRGMTDVTDTVDDNGRLIRKNAINKIPEISVTGSASNVKKSPGGGRSGGGNITKTEQTYAPDSIAAQQALVQQLTKQWNEAGAEVRSQYVQPLVEAEAKLNEMKNEQALLKEQAQGKLKGGEVQTEGLGTGGFAALPEIGKGLSDETMEKVREGMAKMNQTAKESKQSFGLAANAAGALGSALAGIDDPGARAAGIVLQSIASIAMGFAAASASPAVTGTGWGWLAFLGAGIAALATTISTIHQLTNLAEGGIVGGNSYSGDNIYGGGAMVNSGELVLNKAQQGNLASQLSGNGMQGIKVAGKIKGTDIILSVDRTLQLQGKQLLTWG